MDVEFYVTEILTNGLLPFVRQTFPDGFQSQQDNDPKHTSNRAKFFMEESDVNWWITPAESPDLKPIELLWQELKHFVRNTVKLHTKDELVNRIAQLWQERVDPEKCSRYIGHLQSVLPIVVARQGKASGK